MKTFRFNVDLMNLTPGIVCAETEEEARLKVLNGEYDLDEDNGGREKMQVVINLSEIN